MPELPEVETTVRGISPYLVGQRFDFVRVSQASLRWPVPFELADILTGATCLSVTRRAKYILIETDDRPVLAHLGMSGSFRLVSPNTPLKTHDHVQIGVGEWELRYHDPRRFGCILWADSERAERLLEGLGPEPLSDAFNGAWLHRLAKTRSVAVKSFIMSNPVVVGVGNIYASEALFMSGIRPTRPANQVSLARYNRLAEAIKTVLARSIESGGTTLRDFVNSDGEPGYFQQTLQVYGRAGEPCRVCDRIIRNEVIGGRSSHYCPNCQR